MSDDHDAPLRRALSLANAGVGVAGSYLGYALQRAFLDETKRNAKLKATHTRAGRRMADEMKALRGAAMKLGQTLSLQTGTLPDEALAELATLQMSAPPMHPSLVRAQFKQSLGAHPEDIFKQFESEPFAAASLGQVHHAVTRKGEQVAVKIQYPGIRQSLANDFKMFRAISKPAQASGHIPKHAIDEVEQQIVAETDYRKEAANIEFFHRHLAPLDYVAVPRVLHEYSSDKVLTMSLMKGQHLDDFLARRPSQKLKDKLGERLFDLFYFQVLKVEALHADPHWGNYLFTNDGGISLVDFGCAKYMSKSTVDYLRAGFLFPGSTSSPEFHRLLEKYYEDENRKLPRATRRALIAFAENFYRRVYPPSLDHDVAFDFSDPQFLQDFLAASKDLFKTKGVLIELIFLARAEMGMYQTLHRLKARVHTSQIVRKYL
ncbi:MAG TPA: AarF/ABC1/UbiB kinase family protein [Pyrinomonadaceae bacterium]|jgi:predicted unusual protein kinase regulating ubiquinone biosynthesis (AarF/ABC1/UbiB family)|nr:AarF/ABC1/UbiB kinase family protein [Pyrinomonadaceae bacterium]